jgi:hypothetical protein
MKIAASLEERNKIIEEEGAILCTSNGDGTWTIYQSADELPQAMADMLIERE